MVQYALQIMEETRSVFLPISPRVSHRETLVSVCCPVCCAGTMLNGLTNASDERPFDICKTILDPEKAKTLSMTSMQQTTAEEAYSTLARLSTSGPVVGATPCASTCNPGDDLPILCQNKTNPDKHSDWDMLPDLITVIPAYTATDSSPYTLKWSAHPRCCLHRD